MRQWRTSRAVRRSVFQSTHPHRVRPGSEARNGLRYQFQSTHPHRVRLYQVKQVHKNLLFQSTHPHRVRQRLLRPLQLLVMFQSTHPHRVRPSRTNLLANAELFQSTHPHRVRRLLFRHNAVACSFNPRTHIGCDLIIQFSCSCGRSFNPRTHIGCDNWFTGSAAPTGKFQSTHPHRVRPLFLYPSTNKTVSIHAPT